MFLIFNKKLQLDSVVCICRWTDIPAGRNSDLCLRFVEFVRFSLWSMKGFLSQKLISNSNTIRSKLLIIFFQNNKKSFKNFIFIFTQPFLSKGILCTPYNGRSFRISIINSQNLSQNSLLYKKELEKIYDVSVYRQSVMHKMHHISFLFEKRLFRHLPIEN